MLLCFLPHSTAVDPCKDAVYRNKLPPKMLKQNKSNDDVLEIPSDRPLRKGFQSSSSSTTAFPITWSINVFISSKFT